MVILKWTPITVINNIYLGLFESGKTICVNRKRIHRRGGTRDPN